MARDAKQPLPNAKITTVGLPQPVTLPLPADQVKSVLEIPRTNLKANIGSNLFRFQIKVSWQGAGSPVMVPILTYV